MANEALAAPTPESPIVKKKFASSTFMRLVKYSGLRLVTMAVTVTIGVYLTILIANMGGYVDTIIRNEIRDNTTQSMIANPAFRNLESSMREKLIQEKIASEIERQGLNQPFAVRSFRYLTNALTLNLGRAVRMTSDHGSKEVRLILLERLPATLLLTGTSNLILFFGSVFIALSLSRKYGSWLDKLTIALSPTSAAPPWFYGIFFILIFAAVFRILPFGGLVDSPPPENRLDYGLNILKHLILPGMSVIIQFDLPEHLQLADIFPDLFQRGLCGNGKGEGTAAAGCGAAIHSATHAANHHHEFCPAGHHPVDRVHHYRDGFPVARAWDYSLSSHRVLRHSRDRWVHDHLCLFAGPYGIFA